MELELKISPTNTPRVFHDVSTQNTRDVFVGRVRKIQLIHLSFVDIHKDNIRQKKFLRMFTLIEIFFKNNKVYVILMLSIIYVNQT